MVFYAFSLGVHHYPPGFCYAFDPDRANRGTQGDAHAWRINVGSLGRVFLLRFTQGMAGWVAGGWLR